MSRDRLPFVIDNQRVRLADVLNAVIARAFCLTERDIGGVLLDGR